VGSHHYPLLGGYPRQLLWEVRLEEVNEAVSVSPLGISRAEARMHADWLHRVQRPTKGEQGIISSIPKRGDQWRQNYILIS